MGGPSDDAAAALSDAIAMDAREVRLGDKTAPGLVGPVDTEERRVPGGMHAEALAEITMTAAAWESLGGEDGSILEIASLPVAFRRTRVQRVEYDGAGGVKLTCGPVAVGLP